jgi:diguanylate cyclase (GGDEF)-like protein
VAIDPRALAALIALNSFAISLAILLSASTYPRAISRSLYIFAASKILVAVGLSLVALRGVLPDLLSVVAGNTLPIIGLSLNYPAVREIQGKDYRVLPFVLIGAAMAAGTSYFTFIDADLRGVRLVVSGTAFLIAAAIADEMLLRFRGYGQAHIIGGINILVLMTAFGIRTFQSLNGEATPIDALYDDWVERMCMITTYFAGTVSAVNCVLLCNDTFNGQLRLLAITDSLTGLTNRRRLMERGEEEVRRAKRFRHPLAVLVIDIDHFKRINDTWGHGTGDRAIKAVAEVCVATVREVDIVGRLGGEEFAIVLPETDLATAGGVAERLRRAVESAPVDTGDGTLLSLTASIGVAILAGQASFDDLLSRADAAMYAAKRSGRNRVGVDGREHLSSN